MKSLAVILVVGVAVCLASEYKKDTYDAKPVKAVYKEEKPYDDETVYEPKPYSFGYAIKEENDESGRQENSDGKAVSGSYHLNLPDGRKQIVTYKADPVNGYVADVQFVGEAVYPDHITYEGPHYREPVKPASYPPKADYPSKPKYD